MAAVTLTAADLEPFATIAAAKADVLVEDAVARAARVAPCILDASLSETNEIAARGVIRDAVLRRNDAGSGALQSEDAGPFSKSLDTREPRRVLFWPSEIKELQAICADHNEVASSGAFSVDTWFGGGVHAASCALYFGATYCSCGASLTGFAFPLFGA